MLIVSTPPENTAVLRFVTSKDSFSNIIRIGNEAPVSHVEAVLPDHIIAALLKGGVQQLNYDYAPEDTLQILVNIPMSPSMYAMWARFLYSKVGELYDWQAIAGFVFHDATLHSPNHLICSALQVDALRHCGFWARQLSQQYHAIDPVTVLLMLQADPRTIIGPTERV